MINRKYTAGLMLIALVSCTATPAWADRGEKYNRGKQGHPPAAQKRQAHPPAAQKRPGYVLDKKHRHDHYYPPRGYHVPSLPRGYRKVPYRGKPYYYYHGTWYLYSGTRFVVVLPPIGVTVPILPPYYTTIWVGSVPYYYANGIYYVWRPAERVYVVTNPPSESEVSEEAERPQELFVYPKQGQSEQRQASDRFQCHQWAVDQTGFDPTRAGGNVAESEYYDKRSDYQRAMKACLEARGYSVQ